jgi:hypothetical protein
VGGFSTLAASTAVLEQAKGVLIFRYGIDAVTAFSLLELWSAENGHAVDAVAHAVVHDICQGDRNASSDPQLVRWLEDRLRHEFPRADRRLVEAVPVTVAVDHSSSSLDAVVEAARQAARAGVPLELTMEHLAVGDVSALSRAELMQRIDLAVEVAREVSPGLDVRVPADSQIPQTD